MSKTDSTTKVNCNVLRAAHPDDVRHYDTELLRRHFVMETVMRPGEVCMTYSLYDRIAYGGIVPVESCIELPNIPQLKADYFLERREIGVVNIGAGVAVVEVDSDRYELHPDEAIYIGRGKRSVTFSSVDSGHPAMLYFASAPAHKAYKTQIVSISGRAGTLSSNSFDAGSQSDCNERRINQLIVNNVLEEGPCQLQMGLTQIKPGSVWNTMPAHTHDRRVEVYMYYDTAGAVAHFMGEPSQTRVIWMDECQAVMSPEWSIHSGVGTGCYKFIWAMAGENLDYTDMDTISPEELR